MTHLKSILALTAVAAILSVGSGSYAHKTADDSRDAEYVLLTNTSPLGEPGVHRIRNRFFGNRDSVVPLRDTVSPYVSSVFNGYFFAETGPYDKDFPDGHYTLYKFGEKPEPVKGCEDLVSVGYMCEGIMPVVKKNERITFIDGNGDVRLTLNPIDGREITWAQSFVSEGLIAVKDIKGLWGYINAKGEVAVPLKYSNAELFSEGLAVVRKGDDSYRVIDTTGKTVFKLKKGDCPQGAFYNGLIRYNNKREESWGLLDRKGHKVCRLTAHAILDYNERYVVCSAWQGSNFVTDLHGNVIHGLDNHNCVRILDGDRFLGAERNQITTILDTAGRVEKTFKGHVLYDKCIGFYRQTNYVGFARDMSGDKFILIDDEGRERPGTEFTMPYIDSSIGNCGVVFSDYSGLPAKDLPFMTAIYEPDSVLLSPESLELIPTRHVKTHTVSPATQAPDTVATSDSLKLVEISGMAIIDDSKTMYPGGEEALFKFLRDNIKYPEEASKNNIGGCVVVQFIVEADGSVSNIEIVSNVHPALDAEALRVVSLMPKWNSFDDGPRGICYRLPLYFKQPTQKPQAQAQAQPQQPQVQPQP